MQYDVKNLIGSKIIQAKKESDSYGNNEVRLNLDNGSMISFSWHGNTQGTNFSIYRPSSSNERNA